MSVPRKLPFWRRWFGLSAPNAPQTATPHAVVLYTSRTCPLCDEALEVIAAVRRQRRFALEVIDITDRADLQVLYGHEIPVVFVDGTKRFFGRVDPVLFRRLLDR